MDILYEAQQEPGANSDGGSDYVYRSRRMLQMNVYIPINQNKLHCVSQCVCFQSMCVRVGAMGKLIYNCD